MPAILFLLFSASIIPSSSLATAPQPNILLILVDDMGWGDPRCFKSESKMATPHIDKLAAEGMKFTDTHSGASICVPIRYTLLTGRMPYRNWKSRTQ